MTGLLLSYLIKIIYKIFRRKIKNVNTVSINRYKFGGGEGGVAVYYLKRRLKYKTIIQRKQRDRNEWGGGQGLAVLYYVKRKYIDLPEYLKGKYKTKIKGK